MVAESHLADPEFPSVSHPVLYKYVLVFFLRNQAND